MRDIWEITTCSSDELLATLEQGWEPYSAVWINERQPPVAGRVRFKEVLLHFLKRKVISVDVPAKVVADDDDG